MKLFHFNPNAHGSEYFVMAVSKENAFFNLITKLTESARTGHGHVEYINHFIMILEIWKDSEKFNSHGYPLQYTCEEYGENEVVITEIG